MQFSFVSIAVGALWATSNVLAKTDSEGNYYDCEQKYALLYPLRRLPTCHPGKGTIISVFSGIEYPGYAKVGPLTVKGSTLTNGECYSMTQYGTTIPPATVTLTPCP